MADAAIMGKIFVKTERHGVREFAVRATFNYDPEGGEPGGYTYAVAEIANGLRADWESDEISYDTAKSAFLSGVEAVIDQCEDDDDPRNDPQGPEDE